MNNKYYNVISHCTPNKSVEIVNKWVLFRSVQYMYAAVVSCFVFSSPIVFTSKMTYKIVFIKNIFFPSSSRLSIYYYSFDF